MRYAEIIEDATTAERVWDATKATHDALRSYRKKQDAASTAATAANRLKPGPQKQQRLGAAQSKATDARRVYGSALSRANQRRADALRAGAASGTSGTGAGPGL